MTSSEEKYVRFCTFQFAASDQIQNAVFAVGRLSTLIGELGIANNELKFIEAYLKRLRVRITDASIESSL